jgi:hypothetical protein
MERIATDSFSCDPELVGTVLFIRLAGTGDAAAVAPLSDCLKTVQSEAKRLELREIRFDLSTLYFLNSSCLKAFINFLFGLNNEKLTCAIKFVTNPNLEWQPRSLAALERMSRGVVSIV